MGADAVLVAPLVMPKVWALLVVGCLAMSAACSANPGPADQPRATAAAHPAAPTPAPPSPGSAAGGQPPDESGPTAVRDLRIRSGQEREQFSLDPADGGSVPWPDEPGLSAEGGPYTITDVNTGHHSGYDRLVFTFTENGVCPYLLGYVIDWHLAFPWEDTAPRSGRPTDVYLKVDFASPSNQNPLLKTGVEYEFRGPLTLPGIPGTGTVDNSVNFHDGYAWTVTLDDIRPFRAYELADPPRLVIDFWTETSSEAQ